MKVAEEQRFEGRTRAHNEPRQSAPGRTFSVYSGNDRKSCPRRPFPPIWISRVVTAFLATATDFLRSHHGRRHPAHRSSIAALLPAEPRTESALPSEPSQTMAPSLVPSLVVAAHTDSRVETPADSRVAEFVWRTTPVATAAPGARGRLRVA